MSHVVNGRGEFNSDSSAEVTIDHCEPAEKGSAATAKGNFIFVPAVYCANRVAKVTGGFAHRQDLLQTGRKLQWLRGCCGLRLRELLPTSNRRSVMSAC